MKTRIEIALPVLLITIAGLVAATLYWPGLSGPFLLDDANNVVRHLLNEWNFDAFVESVFRNESGPLGRPIPVASFIFSGLLHGNAEWGFKYHNLLLHLLIGLAGYVFIVKLAIITELSEAKSHWIAALSASLWLLHPLHISTTLYVVQRMAQLSCFFVLCALIAYIHGRASTIIKTKILCYAVLIPVFCTAGLFSKENAVLLPLFILALELFLSAHLNKEPADKLAVWWLAYMPLVIGSIGLLVFSDRLLDYSDRTYTLAERLLTQIDVIFLYLQQVVLPRLAYMGLFLDDQAIRSTMDVTGWSKFMALIGLLGLGILLLARGSLIGFGIVFFFVGHALESTIIPLEIIFEHRNYLPSIGLILVIVVIATCIPIALSLKAFVGLLYVTLFAAMLYARTDTWTSEERILSTSVHEHPNSVRAHVTLSNYYMDKGYIDEGLEHIRTARAFQPNESGLINMEVLVRCNTAFIADEIYDASLNAFSNYPLSAYGLSTLNALVDFHRAGQCPALNMQKIEMLIEATLSRALETSPDKNIIQYVHLLKARLKYWNGETQEALFIITDAFNHRNNPRILFETIDMLIAMGRLEDAEEILFRIEQENLINSSSNRHSVKKYTLQLEAQRGSAPSN